MTSRITVVGLMSAAVLAVAGCAAESDSSPPDGRYVSTDVRGHTLVDGSSIVITFDADTVSFEAGCNTFFGAVDLSNSTVSIAADGQLASTMMACSPELMAQDEWLRTFLGSGPDWTLDADDLVLEAGPEVITAQRSSS